MNKKYPTTIEEAAEIVYKPFSNKFYFKFIRESKEKTLLLYHSSMGRRIRNKFGLWQENEALLQGKHPDEVSWDIMSLVYDKCFDELRYPYICGKIEQDPVISNNFEFKNMKNRIKEYLTKKRIVW